MADGQQFTDIKGFDLDGKTVSFLKGQNENCGAAYGVIGVPDNILIDKDGKIIEHSISIEKLKRKLKELLDGN